MPHHTERPNPSAANAASAALGAFAIDGTLTDLRPHGTGHIHETFAATYALDGAARRYLLQRLNHHVFTDPEAMLANIARVTQHVRRALAEAGQNEDGRAVLKLVPARDGSFLHRDGDGHWWRVYDFIEGSYALETPRHPEDTAQAARAFARFQRLLAGYDGPPLAETIPRFHDTPHRFAQFADALARDPANRAATARAEIEQALAGEPLAGSLLALERRGEISRRIVHNDTKLNNVLFDENTGASLCVTDLDTVMPGLALYDFGDLVRTAASSAAEDEPDPRRVAVRPEMFLAAARGWMAGAGDSLLPVERASLVLAARLLTYECGLRFLADHLLGDVYFKIHRPAHNLERCRAQFALERSLAAHEEALQGAAEELPEAL